MKRERRLTRSSNPGNKHSRAPRGHDLSGCWKQANRGQSSLSWPYTRSFWHLQWRRGQWTRLGLIPGPWEYRQPKGKPKSIAWLPDRLQYQLWFDSRVPNWLPSAQRSSLWGGRSMSDRLIALWTSRWSGSDRSDRRPQCTPGWWTGWLWRRIAWNPISWCPGRSVLSRFCPSLQANTRRR